MLLKRTGHLVRLASKERLYKTQERLITRIAQAYPDR
jgi:hypothetical protein